MIWVSGLLWRWKSGKWMNVMNVESNLRSITVKRKGIESALIIDRELETGK